MRAFSAIRLRIATWYQGTYVPPPKNDPNSRIVFIGFGFYVQPRLARVLGAIAGFYVRHWQWVWSTFIGLGLFIASLALK